MTTCYDYWSARILSDTSIDTILIGDSAAMVMHGRPSTLPATTDLMVLHTEAVARGAPEKFLIADMPFLSFRKGLSRSTRQNRSRPPYRFQRSVSARVHIAMGRCWYYMTSWGSIVIFTRSS